MKMRGRHMHQTQIPKGRNPERIPKRLMQTIHIPKGRNPKKVPKRLMQIQTLKSLRNGVPKNTQKNPMQLIPKRKRKLLELFIMQIQI